MNSLELQRRLKDAHLSDQATYIIAFLYEKFMELERSHDAQASLMLQMAESIQGFVALSEETLKRVARGTRPEGVEVASVHPDPDDMN